jgi:hypothetical protein
VALVARESRETIRHQKPNYGTGTTALVTGAIASTISIATLSSLDSWSSARSCSEDSNGKEQCSSPRGNATAVGVVGLLAGAALITTGIVTVASREKSERIASMETPPVVTQLIRGGVPCGEGTAAGFGLVLKRGETVLAQTTTNANGEFAAVVPSNVFGTVTLYVDRVPTSNCLVRLGTGVANYDIPASPSEPAPPKETAPADAVSPSDLVPPGVNDQASPPPR